MNSHVTSDLVAWQREGFAVIYSSIAAAPLFTNTHTVEALFRGEINSIRAPVLTQLKEARIVVEDDAVQPEELLREGARKRSQTVSTGSTIRMLDLIVSEGCNFGCPHCIHSRDVAASGERRINTYMTPDMAVTAIDTFCDLLRNNLRRDLWVHIGSAEPLLAWKTVLAIIAHVNEVEGFDTKRISINSNLSLMTQEMAQVLLDAGVIVSTSLDGSKIDNDKVRILKSGKGTFELIVSKIKELKAFGFSMDSISLTLTDRNIVEFDALAYINTLKDLGITGVSVDFDLVGSASISPELIIETLLSFHEMCLSNGIECYGSWTKPFENLFRGDDEVDWNILGFCKAVEGGNVSVSPQGSLHMCGYTSANLGTLQSMHEDYPKRLSALLDTRAKLVEEHCEGCELVKVCGGQCHATHEVASAEQTSKIDSMCEVYRGVTKELALRKALAEVPAV